MHVLRLLPAAALALASCSAVRDLEIASRPMPAPPPVRSPPSVSPSDRLPEETLVSRFVEGRPLKAPSGFLVFCAETPSDCGGEADRSVAWDPGVKAEVEAINAFVNQSIQPANDAFETWSVGVVKGDCEDYVLTKRRRLIEAGLPPSSLRIAVATTAAGEMHAVLVVKTSSGDFVLDNRNDEVLAPDATDLRWIKMASAQDPRIWHTIRPETARS